MARIRTEVEVQNATNDSKLRTPGGGQVWRPASKGPSSREIGCLMSRQLAVGYESHDGTAPQFGPTDFGCLQRTKGRTKDRVG